MREIRTTPVRVVHQGDVALAHEYGYDVRGDGDAVCFFIDISGGRAAVEATTQNWPDRIPCVWLGVDESGRVTEVEFPEYPGWRVHCGGAGKTIAIALVRGDA